MSSCSAVGKFVGKKADAAAIRQFEAAKAYIPFDVLIVPGIPFENGQWDDIMKGRVLWSWILYKNGFVKNIIYSGDAVYSPYKESFIMGLYAKELGIPDKHIFYDTNARHSTENIYYSYLLAKEKGFKTIALGTDPYVQSPSLRGYTKRRFTSYIHHIPFVRDSLEKYNPVINSETAFVKNFESILKDENFWERLKGTLGMDIDWRKHEGSRLPPL